MAALVHALQVLQRASAALFSRAGALTQLTISQTNGARVPGELTRAALCVEEATAATCLAPRRPLAVNATISTAAFPPLPKQCRNSISASAAPSRTSTLAVSHYSPSSSWSPSYTARTPTQYRHFAAGSHAQKAHPHHQRRSVAPPCDQASSSQAQRGRKALDDQGDYGSTNANPNGTSSGGNPAAASAGGGGGGGVYATPEVEVQQHGNFELATCALPPLARPRTPAEQRALQAALAVVSRLRDHGYTAMFVGGWVRDQFLRRSSPDIDLVSNATFVQVFDVFGPRHCKLKGGFTCDVTWGGHTFEVTSYRGGLHEDSAEAEWRDAACRDFTINALFFDPQPPAQAAASDTATSTTPAAITTAVPQNSNSNPKDSGKDTAAAADPSSAASAAAAAATMTGVAAVAATAAGAAGAPAVAPPGGRALAAPQPHLQPAGRVKDYVGGLEDLRARRLRVFRDHERLGLVASSVEADPIRVLRAARMSVEHGLQLDPYTESRVRRAAAMCGVRPPTVTANRVFRELSKMAELDITYSGGGARGGIGGRGPARSPAAAAVYGTTTAVRGGPGSPMLSAALELCRSWRALSAVFPGLPQEHLRQVITGVIPELPASMPLELKLSCLVVGPTGYSSAGATTTTATTTGGSGGGGGGGGSRGAPGTGPDASGGRSDFLPWNVPERYQPIRSLLSATRLAQPHWPDLLCGLSDLVLTDFAATHREADWAELLAAEGSELVEVAIEAFIPRVHGWRHRLREGLSDNRRRLAPLIERARQRRPPQLGGSGLAGGSGLLAGGSRTGGS